MQGGDRGSCLTTTSEGCSGLVAVAVAVVEGVGWAGERGEGGAARLGQVSGKKEENEEAAAVAAAEVSSAPARRVELV